MADIEFMYERFRGVDLGKGEASQPADKTEAIGIASSPHSPHPHLSPFSACSSFSSSSGKVFEVRLEAANRDLISALCNALHCRIKWGGREEDLATLAVLLIKVSDSGSVLDYCIYVAVQGMRW